MLREIDLRTCGIQLSNTDFGGRLPLKWKTADRMKDRQSVLNS